jgi:hypothetical protein
MSGIRQILGIGAALTAGWLCRESYRGSKDTWQQKYEAHETDEMYEHTKYGWGHYSGNPQMDHWAHQLDGVRRFGWFGSKASINLIKFKVEGFINDVIFPNLTPIAIGIGGLYAALGKNMLAPFSWVHGFFTKRGPGMLTPITKGLGQMAGALGKGASAGLSGLGSLATKGGWGTTALLAIAAYGLYKFWRVDTHQEQHEFFKDFLAGTDQNH